jgi:hypothetical protein
MLSQLGFIDYVLAQQKAGEYRLFPDCLLGGDGSYSPFSKHFSRFLSSLNIHSRTRVVFHSFRHCFEDALREARLEDSVRFRLMGRTLRHSSEEYGHGYSTGRLLEEISKVKYSGLNLNDIIRNIQQPM